MNSQTCSYLWRRMTFSFEGSLRPCCRFIERDGVLPRQSLEAFNDEYFRSIRRKMLAGQPVSGCVKCYQQEQAGALSLRQVANQAFGIPEPSSELAKSSDVQSAEIFLGRECNLKCRMCGPYHSTKWREDARWVGIDPQKLPKLDVDPVELLRPLIKNMRHLKILGGEPLITPAHGRVLDLAVNEGTPGEMVLEYATNVTIFPGENIIRQWAKFKSIFAVLSVDGVRDVNSLIRYPAKWEVIEANVKKYFELAREMPNLKVFLGCTVGAYNFHNVPALVEWWRDVAPSEIGERVIENISPTVQPEYLNARILPQAYKREMVDLYRRTLGVGFHGLIHYMMSEDWSDRLPEFIRFTNDLDRVRNQNTWQMIPELSVLLEPQDAT